MPTAILLVSIIYCKKGFNIGFVMYMDEIFKGVKALMSPFLSYLSVVT